MSKLNLGLMVASACVAIACGALAGTGHGWGWLIAEGVWAIAATMFVILWISERHK